MPDRHRSKDGSRDTDKVPGDKTKMQEQGRSGGALAGKIGTRDELKRAEQRPAGATRVEGQDERESKIKKKDS